MHGNGQAGRDIEAYTQATKSEYHVDHRSVNVDRGQGSLVPVVFCFVVNALDVVVAKTNNDLSAYKWIEAHCGLH
jgi:hypothetical protein